MEALKRQRAAIKGQITRISSCCDNENTSLSKAKTLKFRLEQLMQDFERVQTVIEDENAEVGVEEAYRADFESVFYEVHAKLSDIIECKGVIDSRKNINGDLDKTLQFLADNQCTLNDIVKKMAESLPRTISITKCEGQARLPEIRLPEFSGKFDEWVRFRDLFVTMVESKESLTGVEKMEYLQTRLRGDALSLIKHLPSSNNNFKVAWELIKSHFDKPDVIMVAHLDNIFDQPALKGNILADIKVFFNSINENLNALRALELPVDQWSMLLIYILCKKLDAENRILWYREIKDKSKPTITEFITFVKGRISELESINFSRPGRVNYPSNKAVQRDTNKRVLNTMVQSCIKCKRNHMLYQCNEFRELPIEARRELVKLNKICINCLRSKHTVSECKFSVCKLCSEKHNTLLHHNETETKPHSMCPRVPAFAANSSSVNTLQHIYRDCFTMLPTVILSVMDPNGKLHDCRALLDSGSQSTLISEACVQRLRLKRRHARIPISGIGQDGNVQGTNGAVNLILCARDKPNVTLATRAYILSFLTGNLPSVDVPKANFKYFEHLSLADPGSCTPNKIDILLGADVFFDILAEGKIVHPAGSPIAQNTIFGWIIAGNVTAEAPNLNILHTKLDLDYLLRRFWDYEDLHGIQKVDEEKDQIEEHFIATHRILPDGRFVVSLPFKDTSFEFGDSRKAALKRLYAMERRFSYDPALKRKYTAFMTEYEQLGHMAPVPSNDIQRQVFYLPHHAVLKPSSTTTKLRVVFDASSRSSNGVSLNDCLLVGPTIQHDLITSIIKFRKFRVAVKADIAKMYRQIRVSEKDVHYQRIVWREDVKEEVRDYNLLTLTYGTAPASFLATRVLKQVGMNNFLRYPQASSSILNDFYVDDYMSGFHSLEDAVLIKNDINKILSEAGLELRKWASNSLDFLAEIEPSHRELSTNLYFGESEVKTLGLIWDTKVDCFKFSFSSPIVRNQITKREVLSDIARIFDPLGWLSPAVVKMKIFMKKLWIKKVGWDTYIPAEFYEEWAAFRANINQLSLLRIPRWLAYEQELSVELHGFADASESAYAAALYLRVVQLNGSVQTSLFCAKTRVAPVKPTLTIPRLELCGSLLLARLFSKVKDSRGIPDIECFAYTDSSTVLHWIQGYPRPRNVFADNRLPLITTQIPASSWHYVRSIENPADCATRGFTPERLTHLDIWWKGPLFLRDPIVIFSELPNVIENSGDESERCLTTSSAPEWDIFSKFSSFNRLLRVVARCLWWRHKLSEPNRKTFILSLKDIRLAKIALFKLAQARIFPDEIARLQRNESLHSKSKILRMNPFIDQDGILRVGGRLENANISFDQKYPIILHKDHRLVKLMLLDCHYSNMHAGIRQMSYLMSLNYFILGLYHSIKRIVYQCVSCTRQRGASYSQQMANLPRQRLVPGAAFSCTGVDYAGPFIIRTWKGRGAKQYKAYISLFICLTTKALHLEAVTELSSAAFIAALRRFVARRGKCHTLFSDNGTNFVGANQQLREWTNLLQSSQFQESVSDELTSRSIDWHFIPPHAPHFGGLWEAGIKTIKYHLRRVMGDTSVTFEEFNTILCQVEACANSRPLCIKYEGDVDPTTPAHFLIMRPMASVPDQNLLDHRVSTLKRWQYLQRLVQEFWRRWANDYLSQLQKRSKWAQKSKCVQINDVVIVKEDNQAPCQWLIGRVTKTYPGRDGLVRVASVTTSKGEIKRPICKLCPLFVDEAN